ncbi:hypothetical protein VNO80_19265 [Phaseolus coccineus]|uniref:Uncharacterized protein n=1 Tax=Phaseolus coccineus TaxID=3886 RepID=A0AAN9MLW5_PHACN
MTLSTFKRKRLGKFESNTPLMRRERFITTTTGNHLGVVVKDEETPERSKVRIAQPEVEEYDRKQENLGMPEVSIGNNLGPGLLGGGGKNNKHGEGKSLEDLQCRNLQQSRDIYRINPLVAKVKGGKS